MEFKLPRGKGVWDVASPAGPSCTRDGFGTRAPRYLACIRKNKMWPQRVCSNIMLPLWYPRISASNRAPKRAHTLGQPPTSQMRACNVWCNGTQSLPQQAPEFSTPQQTSAREHHQRLMFKAPQYFALRQRTQATKNWFALHFDHQAYQP